MPDSDRPAASAADLAALRDRLAELITRALNLEIAPAAIDPDAPLYGEGLGLDSIDILEIALVVAKEFGVQIRAEGEENAAIFRSSGPVRFARSRMCCMIRSHCWLLYVFGGRT